MNADIAYGGVPSPSEFLRNRRPEYFSDSVMVEKPQLERPLLEYHLDTLTNRSQEHDFEHFARGLTERLICPNLLPHTGPTGGGDSGVDSETIPVADSLALAWYHGIGREAAEERWGFAFSAKRDWRQKLRSDVAKIAGTNRGYRRAFFITNQYVRDRERSELEDALTRDHGLDVRILDRTWILDSVFEHRLEGLAIDALDLPAALRPERRQGPLDTERERDLAELDASVEVRLREGRMSARLVADAIDSAKAARALERPRYEVDGRFLRATEIAKRVGSLHAQVAAVYEWAWTTFWWYEDFARFATLAGEAFELAGASDNAHHLELLSNLWMCLRTAVESWGFDHATAHFDEHTATLLRALRQAAENEDRPSNALHARTLELFMLLLGGPADAESILRDLKSTMERAQSLLGYPFDSTAALVREMGPAFGSVGAYDELFEFTVSAAGERSGELTAARMLLDRGAQLITGGQHYEAIRYIGRGLGRLYKEESRRDLLRALYLLGVAYAEAGLLWAARGSLLNAAAVATADFHERGNLTRWQVGCYRRMRWIEAELGRLPQALEWHELAVVATAALDADAPGPAGGGSDGQFDAFDPLLGTHFLRADLRALRELQQMPDVLERLGLFMSAAALLHALGHAYEIPVEVITADGGTADGFFVTWRDAAAAERLRPLVLGVGETSVLTSDVLGCHVELTHDNRPPAIELAESLLASLESLVSTGLTERLIAHEPLLRVFVRVSELGEAPFSFRVVMERGRPVAYVACRPFYPHALSYEEQGQIKDKLRRLVVELFAHIVFVPEDSRVLESLIGEDRALQRAVDFTGSFVVAGNVLGNAPKTSIARWVWSEARTFALTRSEAWDAALPARTRAEALASETRPDDEPARADHTLPAAVRHSDVRTLSYIRIPLWERAGWKGVCLAAVPDGSRVPLLGLIFTHAEIATDIFRGLREDLGEDDREDRLRISILRGISASNPAWYRVVLGSSVDAIRAAQSVPPAFATTVARVHTMTPDEPTNIDRFLTSYRAAGSYVLAPVVLGADGMPLVGQARIRKHVLHVRHAWEVGPNDLDAVAIHDDDDVILPTDAVDPPVALLRRQRADRGTRR